mgnify:FL=1
MEILFALAGLAAGIVIGILYGRGKSGALAAEAGMLRRQMEDERRQYEERHREAMDVQQARFGEVMEKVKAEMKDAANEMLMQRQKEFAEQSNTQIGNVVNPLRQSITEMRKAMDDNMLRQTSMTSEMRTGIENMMRQSEAAKRSTEELTRAFRNDTKAQGDWGETVLDEILESQGLRRGIHYETQATIRDARAT